MKKTKPILWFLAAVIVSASLWLIIGYKDALDELSHRKTDKAVLKKDIQELRDEAARNRKHLEKLRKDPDFQDATARQELGYGKQGERVYRFPPENE